VILLLTVVSLAACTAHLTVRPQVLSGLFAGETADGRPVVVTFSQGDEAFRGEGTIDGRPVVVGGAVGLRAVGSLVGADGRAERVAPPVVAIRQPDRLLSSRPPAGGAVAGVPTQLVAAAWDAEHAVADLQLRWEFVALDGLGGAPDPTPPAPNPPPVVGTLAAGVTFPAPELYYRVTFQATDTGGLASSDSVEIRVVGEVIE
jgi:hypothetical protein